MSILNKKLYRTIGITFSFKEFLQDYLLGLGSNDVVIDALTTPQLESYLSLVDKFVKCTPAMGFSAKQFVYEALEILVLGLIAEASPSPTQAEQLNGGLLKILRYVGIEGEEDFNFQQAVFRICETISDLTGAHFPTGVAATIEVTDGGEGFDDSETDLVVDFSSPVVGSSSSPGQVSVNTNASGEIILGTYNVVGGGEGYHIGQIVVLDDGNATSVAIGVVASLA